MTKSTSNPPENAPISTFSRLLTPLFLLACLLIGFFIAKLILPSHPKKLPLAPLSLPSNPPAIRGIFTPSPPFANPAAWQTYCQKMADLQANWLQIDLPTLSAPLSAEAITTAHTNHLKVLLVLSIPTDTATTLPFDAIAKSATAAHGLNIDLLALRSQTSEAEDLETQWPQALTIARNAFDGKVTYVTSIDNYPLITWWQASDDIAITGPFPLSGLPRPTPHDLQVGWQAHLTSIQSISKRENRPVLLLNIYSAEATNLVLQQQAFEAAFTTTQQQGAWLNGLFFRADSSDSDIQNVLKKAWKGP